MQLVPKDSHISGLTFTGKLDVGVPSVPYVSLDQVD
jgi:hypothetical protein